MLDVKGLTVRCGSKVIVDDVSFQVNSGDWIMVVGPNGAGKSTIINAISQGIEYEGEICWNNVSIKKQKPYELAKSIGVLLQKYFVGYAFSVEEVISLGRYAHRKGIFSTVDSKDEELINNALVATGLQDKRKQSVLTLSGGELQRTFLAQVIAQNPTLLMLDELTNHLDLQYQKQVFELLSQWLHESGRMILSVVHDLSLARAYGTKIILIEGGKCVMQGPSREVLNRKTLQKAYHIDVVDWMKTMLSQWNDTE